MIVSIPTPLRSYTGERAEVDANGATLGELLTDLDRRFPGIRFRMIDEVDTVRRHIKVFVNENVIEDLAHPLAEGDHVHVICALSGG